MITANGFCFFGAPAAARRQTRMNELELVVEQGVSVLGRPKVRKLRRRRLLLGAARVPLLAVGVVDAGVDLDERKKNAFVKETGKMQEEVV
jgi:hypothetical protein